MVSSFESNMFTLLFSTLLMGRDNSMIRLMFKLRLDGTWVMYLVVKPTGLSGRAHLACVD